jgi:putative transposase
MVAPAPAAGRRLRRRLTPLVRAAAATPGADHYRKHFPAWAHLWILLWHGLSGSPSLRRTYDLLVRDGRHDAWLGLEQGLSYSQLARSSTSRPLACLEALLVAAVQHVRRTAPPDPLWQLLHKVQALDSSFVRLSAKLCPWAAHGGFTPGIRVQCALEVGARLPSGIHVTIPDTNDHEALRGWDLAALRDWTLLIDLGYYGHRLFAQLRAAQVHFITRLHPQAAYRVTALRYPPATPTPEGDVVLTDETIDLGSPNNRRGTVVPELRLVTSRNAHGEGSRFVTDRFDLTAAEVVRLYRLRWRIELFFRALKRTWGMLHPLGHSQQAVHLTVLLSLLAAVVGLLLGERPAGMSFVAWVQTLTAALLPCRRPTGG